MIKRKISTRPVGGPLRDENAIKLLSDNSLRLATGGLMAMGSPPPKEDPPPGITAPAELSEATK